MVLIIKKITFIILYLIKEVDIVMGFKESDSLIRDYSNIRSILRDVYIFGCYSKDDFVKSGMSARKYDNEKKRIMSYISKDFIYQRNVNRKSIMYCSYHMENGSRNYMAETYRNKTFTMLDFMSYFFVLQLLSDGNEMTLGDILQALPENNEDVLFTKDNLRVKLEELVEQRLIEIVKYGKTVKYRISVDIWEDFSDKELQDIYLFLDFLMNTYPVEVPFYFLRSKLRLYMEIKRGISSEQLQSPMQYKHNHLFNVVDNDVILDVLKAIKGKRRIQIKLNGNENDSVFVTLPIKVLHDSTYGRQYVFCYSEAEEKVVVVRVDHIADLELKDSADIDFDSIVEKCMKAIDDCWCTSLTDKEPVNVVIEFMFDEQNESYVRRRLIREGHGALIQKITDGLYRMTISVNDPAEMIPWIRSFGERARVISSGEYKIEDRIKKDWKRAVEKYEIIS